MKVLSTLLVVLLSALAAAEIRVIYAGFNHLLSVEMKTLEVTAFDFRRDLPPTTTCDIVGHPPLVTNAKLSDWLTLDAIAKHQTDDIDITYMGYEVFLVANKNTGSYVTRRCRDFRPQLELLPCEALATGRTDYLKHPYKTVWIGNNRVMFVNTETNEFSVHPFDADVHTGGDAFGFTFGPLFAGTLPPEDYANSDVSYVQLPNHMGDVLLVYGHKTSLVKGYRFHGAANDKSQWEFKKVFSKDGPLQYHLTPLGENAALFFSQDHNMVEWMISTSTNVGFDIIQGHTGSFLKGLDCRIPNATACVAVEGCAWCPSSYTCHAYDPQSAVWCDSHKCRSDPIVGAVLPGQEVISPECVENPDVESVHADIFDTIDDGYNKLGKNIRLSDEYRNDLGEYPNAEVAPIHPNIDNILGEAPVIVDAEHQDDVIHEKNSVAKGTVYRPPPPSQSAPCMDKQYDSSKAADIPAPYLADWKMNLPPQPVKIFIQSPNGDSLAATEIENCARNVENITGRINATRPLLSTVRLPGKEDFVPRAGDAPRHEETYHPAPTATNHEEDIMNSDKTPHSDLNARWLNPAVESDWSRAPKKASSEDLGFKPSEPHKKSVSDIVHVVDVTKPQVDPDTLMEKGIASQDLANADCTENGGTDAATTNQFNAAMKNSVEIDVDFPPTIEQQLDLAKAEVAHVDGSMALGPLTEEQKPLPLPVSDNQTEQSPQKPAKSDYVLTTETTSYQGEEAWRHKTK